MISKSTIRTRIFSILTLLLFMSSPEIVLSQDYEEWKRQQEKEFQQFKDERDAEFLKMLEEAWEEMEAYLSEDEFKEPKPRIIPEADTNFDIERKSLDESKTVNLDFTAIRSESEFSATALKSIETSRIPSGALRSSMNYYNVEIDYFYHAEDIVHLKERPTQATLMDYWADMSQTNYELWVDRVQVIQDQLKLNDWGTLQFVNQMGEDIFGSSINDIHLFVWFIMTKLGYDLKIGYNRSDVYLLFPTNRRLFNTKFLTVGEKRFYVIQLQENARDLLSMSTYRGSYPDANKSLSLDINTIPSLPAGDGKRELSFYWQETEHKLSIPVNNNLIEYFKYFPNTELDIYVNAASSPEVRRVLLSQLGQIINGKNQVEAVNILLHFVQTAFDYETDDRQFGKQKYMLPDEILYYPYSDCDDRTILFTFLVKQLLDIDVIGLRYPNHIATAVKLDPFRGGDYVMHEGVRYTIADPTFINAQTGLTMPKFQNVSPELVRFF